MKRVKANDFYLLKNSCTAEAAGKRSASVMQKSILFSSILDDSRECIKNPDIQKASNGRLAGLQ